MSHNFDIKWHRNAHGQVTPQCAAGAVFNCQDGGINFPVSGITMGSHLQIGMVTFRPWLPRDTYATGVRAALATEEKDQMLLIEMTLAIVDQSAIDDYDRKLYAIVKGEQDTVRKQASEHRAPL
jgi:hypothetical protein